jgi:hypothetical protein
MRESLDGDGMKWISSLPTMVRYRMRESLEGDEKISSCKKQLFFCCNPSIFSVCRSVAADAK